MRFLKRLIYRLLKRKNMSFELKLGNLKSKIDELSSATGHEEEYYMNEYQNAIMSLKVSSKLLDDLIKKVKNPPKKHIATTRDEFLDKNDKN